MIIKYMKREEKIQDDEMNRHILEQVNCEEKNKNKTASFQSAHKNRVYVQI